MGDYLKGAHTYGEIRVLFRGKVTAGKYCSIAGDVIALMEGHRVDAVSTYPFTSRHFINEWGSVPDYGRVTNGDIEIGNDVWIGHGVTLMSGVKIGDGAIIGAKSVVTYSVPPYAVAAGSPARITRFRFFENQIEEMLKIKWWDWPKEKIKESLPLLMANDINAFIERYK